jgi:hypothetical protein
VKPAGLHKAGLARKTEKISGAVTRPILTNYGAQMRDIRRYTVCLKREMVDGRPKQRDAVGFRESPVQP